MAATPATPFDFPDEIIEQVIAEYCRNEVIVYSKPISVMTSSIHHFNPRHGKGRLAKYKKYFVRRGASILAIAAINQKTRAMALSHLAELVYYDIKDSTIMTHILQPRFTLFIRQIRHITTRASQMNTWSHPLFQPRRFPSLQTLTIYEDWSNDGLPRNKASIPFKDARSFNPITKTFETHPLALAALKRVSEHENTVVESTGITSTSYWATIQSLLARKNRSFVVELVWYVNESMDAVMEVEKPNKPVKIVSAMACERNDMMKHCYFMEEHRY